MGCPPSRWSLLLYALDLHAQPRDEYALDLHGRPRDELGQRRAGEAQRGVRVVAGAAVDVDAHLGDDVAAVAERGHGAELGREVGLRLRLAGDHVPLVGRSADRGLDLDVSREGQQRVHGLLDREALHLEVAHVEAEAEAAASAGAAASAWAAANAGAAASAGAG